MSSISTLRDRRSAVQLHALAEVRRHIGDQDSSSGRKYLADFWSRYHGRVGLYSGVTFNADPAAGLNGWCDYLISQSPQQFVITPPILVAFFLFAYVERDHSLATIDFSLE